MGRWARLLPGRVRASWQPNCGNFFHMRIGCFAHSTGEVDEQPAPSGVVVARRSNITVRVEVTVRGGWALAALQAPETGHDKLSTGRRPASFVLGYESSRRQGVLRIIRHKSVAVAVAATPVPHLANTASSAGGRFLARPHLDSPIQGGPTEASLARGKVVKRCGRRRGDRRHRSRSGGVAISAHCDSATTVPIPLS